MSNCKTCVLLKKRDEGTSPLWDSIYRTPYWDVVHSYNTSLLGWITVVLRRHAAAIDELNDHEAIDIGLLIRRVSIILKEITGCSKTYVIQFAEHPDHPHVHFHVVPRMANMPEDHRGIHIFKYLGVDESERVGEEDMNRIAKAIRSRLTEMA
ncbi:MAG: HIT family protein [Anaerolineae bacterium]|nr:HIT family protein [Anaerolineae bacterium]MCA9892319.1 HIT family protein [Anaerolineae bacterium]